VQPRRTAAAPGFGHHALARRQVDGLAGRQDVVGAVAAAGDPDRAVVDHQPAAAPGLQRQGGGDAQLAVGRAQHLQGGGGGGGHGGSPSWNGTVEHQG
jgi:hypothetical protein